MGRVWNLRTKLVAVLVMVLSGTFLLQSVIHEHNEQQLLLELEKVALDIANDTGELIAEQTRAQLARLEMEALPRAAPAPSPHPAVAGAGATGRTARFIFSESRRRPAGTSHTAIPGGAPDGSVREHRYRVIEIDPSWMSEILRQWARDVAAAREVRAARDVDAGELILLRLIQALRAGELSPPPPTAEFSIGEAESETFVAESGFAPLEVFGVEPAGIGEQGPIADEIEPPTLDVAPYIDRVQQLFNSSKRHDLIATVGVFLIGIALAWFLGVRVTRPVDEVVHGFQRLAVGEFDARVPERPGEEFGHLGRQFNAMVAQLREGRELERELIQRERIQHMGDLAAGVAHDVRNPLNAIHLNIGQIRDEFIPNDDRARERFLRFTSDVQREVERLNQLVTNFLSLARPAAREAEPVEPNELVDELFRLLRKEAIGREVELALELSEGLPPCSWNRQEMKSAFLNIALNALQALAEKGGHLVISTGRRRGPDGEELVVSFADDGPGIPVEDLERVFVPYYTTRKGGTGLGMAIARRTAERHGGRIELESAVGEGTTVSFVFPCVDEGVSA